MMREDRLRVKLFLPSQPIQVMSPRNPSLAALKVFRSLMTFLNCMPFDPSYARVGTPSRRTGKVFSVMEAGSLVVPRWGSQLLRSLAAMSRASWEGK